MNFFPHSINNTKKNPHHGTAYEIIKSNKKKGRIVPGHSGTSSSAEPVGPRQQLRWRARCHVMKKKRLESICRGGDGTRRCRRCCF